MSDHRWRHLFVSRDDELAWLQAAWREAKAGRPHFRVLLGESGLGKTRLVQEFYRWLSREEDPGTPTHPEGYWPDAFTGEAGSLHVNPRFPAERTGPMPPIPWLWWGLRWVMPERRNEVANGCALIDHRADLEPHIQPILAARRLQEVHRDAGWKVVSVLGTVIAQLSPLGWLTAARDAWSIVTESRLLERELLQARDTSPAAAAETNRRELESQVLDTFRLILDPANKQAPTVPVVLILDDAQWADPVTLRFVARLLGAARTENWSLLVIATHWEAEWKADIRDVSASLENLTQLADLTRLLDLGAAWDGVKVIPPVADLSAIVAAALPGVTQPQRDLVLVRAGGNPLLLEEILQFLIRSPQLFEGRNTAAALTRTAERKISEEKFDRHRLVTDRFYHLEEHVRRALGWSSAQGMRFLTSITEAIGQHVAPGYDLGELRPALETAEDPHSLIQLFRDQGRFNLGEFRQAVFQHVAREQLAFDESEAAAVDQALREFLIDWLRRDPEDRDADGLEPVERRDALAMALRLFSPDQPETRGAWTTAMAQLADLHASEYLWRQAHRVAQDLADAAPAGWSLEELAVRWQLATIALLYQMDDLERAHRLAASLVANLSPQGARKRSAEELVGYVFGLLFLGDVQHALGALEPALATYQRGLEIRERLLEENGEAPVKLRGLSLSLRRIGDVQLMLGQREPALASHRRNLEICERLVSEFGETPEILLDLSAACGSIGDVQLELGQRQHALASYRRGLETCERLVSEYGETWEALLNRSVALTKVGNVQRLSGALPAALTSYRDSLAICERLVSEYGEVPGALRRLRVVLNDVGDVQFLMGALAPASASYRRSLELDERLLTEYGETPDALRGLSLTLNRVGDVQCSLGQHQPALASYQRSLEISERFLREHGETPEALRCLLLSLSRVGNVQLALGEREGALNSYRRGLETCERVLTVYGESPDALRDLSVLIGKLGDVQRAPDERERALGLYKRGLETCERVLDEYGETPADLRTQAVTLSNLGELQRELGRREAALISYQRSLDSFERVLTEYGQTPQALRDLSVLFGKLGDVQRGLGGRERALAFYRRGREVSQRLIAEYEPSAEAQRDLALVCSNIGAIEFVLGEKGPALASFLQSLEIHERLLQELGETPNALRDLTLALHDVGDVRRALGECEKALPLYQRSLETRERLLNAQGVSPDALRRLSAAHSNIGEVQLELGRRVQALASYQRGLEIFERVLKEYGENPDALRDLSVALEEVGDAQLALGERESALASYQRSLEISARLLKDYGETPDALRDLAVSHIRLAVVREGPEAIRQLQHARTLLSEIIARGWPTPEAQTDLEWVDAMLRRLERHTDE
jgi:tetratricopeptide (TPR) repeat protein